MDGCADKFSAYLLSNNDKLSLVPTSCSTPSHLNRLFKFKDDDPMMRVTTQYSIEQNIRMESLQFDPREFYPRPDALEMKLAIPKILIEVETALVKILREGLYNMIKNCDTSMSYNAAKFKSTNMKQSELSPGRVWTVNATVHVTYIASYCQLCGRAPTRGPSCFSQSLCARPSVRRYILARSRCQP